MRYQEPSIREKVKKYKERKTSEVIVIPLYPHHAMSTTKTTKIEIDKIVSEEYPSLKVKYIEPFYDDPRYIDALSHSIKPYLDDLDKLIFSYHGIPERHLTKGDVVGDHCMKVENCCDINCKSSQSCYRSNVLATSKLTADQLELADNQWMVSFQSRVSIMGPAWLKPYTDIEIDKLGENGMEKIGVVCPSFIADCLETLEEIEMQAKESFIESGGKELVYIPCLNNNPEFINALESIIEDAVV